MTDSLTNTELIYLTSKVIHELMGHIGELKYRVNSHLIPISIIKYSVSYYTSFT